MNKTIPGEYSKLEIQRDLSSLKNPSFLIEVGYFTILVYANLAPAYGMAFPMVGAGGLAGLALMCILHFGSYSMGAFRPLRFALACGVSFLLIQVFVFQEFIGDGLLRAFVTWILSLIVIQTLIFRPGFLHRFALVAFFIGCATLPFLKVYQSDEIIRIGGEGGVALGNPNYFGMWFGFCTVYFIVAGLEAKNYIIRTLSWSAGLLCLYLMALTVSRGALLGVAIATVIAFQKVLKRSFLPILGFLILMWVIYMSGIFDDLIGYYLHRGTEETGRSRLWSWAVEKFLDSWGMGVGLSNALIPTAGGSYGPHNSFLFFGLSSGMIPLAFYIAYLVQASKAALRARTQQAPYSSFKLPLLSFAMLYLMVADGVFMSPWHIVVLSIAIATEKLHKKPRKPFSIRTTNSKDKRLPLGKF